MLNCNAFHTPNLAGYCPLQLVIGRTPKLIPELEVEPQVEVSKTYHEHFEALQQQLSYFRERLHKIREQRLLMQNQHREFVGFRRGQLVYLYHPSGADLQTGSQKICSKFVGPLVIYTVLDANQYILMSLDGEVFPNVVEATRLKPGFIATSQGNVETLSELIKALRTPNTPNLTPSH